MFNNFQSEVQHSECYGFLRPNHTGKFHSGTSGSDTSNLLFSNIIVWKLNASGGSDIQFANNGFFESAYPLKLRASDIVLISTANGEQSVFVSGLARDSAHDYYSFTVLNATSGAPLPTVGLEGTRLIFSNFNPSLSGTVTHSDGTICITGGFNKFVHSIYISN